jgi:hypothetical protein
VVLIAGRVGPDAPVAPTVPVAGQQPAGSQIISMSFEGESATPAAAPADGGSVFKGGFDS